MIGSEEERPLLIMATVVWLSEWTKMERLVHSDPQREAATMTGYSSYRAEELPGSHSKFFISSGHSSANHRPP